jgi:hypothetical protein
MGTLDQPLLRILFVALLAFAGAWFWGWMVLPGDAQMSEVSADERVRLEKERRPTLDTDQAHHPYQEVDYEEGVDASWYPKGEAPILRGLLSTPRCVDGRRCLS